LSPPRPAERTIFFFQGTEQDGTLLRKEDERGRARRGGDLPGRRGDEKKEVAPELNGPPLRVLEHEPWGKRGLSEERRRERRRSGVSRNRA